MRPVVCADGTPSHDLGEAAQAASSQVRPGLRAGNLGGVPVAPPADELRRIDALGIGVDVRIDPTPVTWTFGDGAAAIVVGVAPEGEAPDIGISDRSTRTSSC